MDTEKIKFSVELSPEANEALVSEAKLNRRSRIAHASLVLERIYNPNAVASVADVTVTQEAERESVAA